MENNKLVYNGVTIEVVQVTPEMAREILLYHNKMNRKMNLRHVKALLNNMQKGTWRFNGNTVCFDKQDELIDGQHRLKAVELYGKPVPMIFVSKLDHDAIKTIDQEIKPRKFSDLLSMANAKNYNLTAAIIEKYFTLSLGKKHNLLSGTGHGGHDNKTKYTVDDKLNEWYDHADFYEGLCVYAYKCYKNSRILLKPSEIGGFYSLLRLQMKHPDESIRGFFDRLYNISMDSNEFLCINDLRSRIQNEANTLRKASSATKTTWIMKTWNLYVSGKKTQHLAVTRSEIDSLWFI